MLNMLKEFTILFENDKIVDIVRENSILRLPKYANAVKISMTYFSGEFFIIIEELVPYDLPYTIVSLNNETAKKLLESINEVI